MKTIVHVWVLECKNYLRKNNPTEHFWGLGDMIRGTIAVYEFCKQNNYNFYLDVQQHPISKYLLNPPTYSDKIPEEGIEFYLQDLKELTDQHFLTNDVLFELSNKFPNKIPFDDDVKNYFKNFLTFKPEYKFEKPFDQYITLHFRLGDKFFTNQLNPYYIQQLIEKIVSPISSMGINMYICSDSLDFLDECKKRESKNIMVSQTVPMHLGNLDLSKKKDESSYIDTLKDFQICSQSNKIISFSVYSWTSGFVKWISEIYNIPVESHVIPPIQ